MDLGLSYPCCPHYLRLIEPAVSPCKSPVFAQKSKKCAIPGHFYVFRITKIGNNR